MRILLALRRQEVFMSVIWRYSSADSTDEDAYTRSRFHSWPYSFWGCVIMVWRHQFHISMISVLWKQLQFHKLSAFKMCAGAIQFTRPKGLKPPPEPTHAIALAIRGTIHYEESGKSNLILLETWLICLLQWTRYSKLLATFHICPR